MTWLLAPSKFVYPRRIPLTRPETSSLYRPSLTTIVTIAHPRDSFSSSCARHEESTTGNNLKSFHMRQRRKRNRFRQRDSIAITLVSTGCWDLTIRLRVCTECMRASNSRYAPRNTCEETLGAIKV